MKRLSNNTIGELPESVVTPQYSREKLNTKIVHLGVGNFHRAHQALFTEAANNTSAKITEDEQAFSQGHTDWGICGVSLRRPDMRDKLAPQDNLYTVEVRNNDRRTQQIVGVITEMLVAPENPSAVIKKLADPNTKIITLTVTEKAYCLTSEGQLDLNNSSIQQDLNNLKSPTTAVGYLAAGLQHRRVKNAGPVTIICCDNLSDNGIKLKAAVSDFLKQCDEQTVDWLADNTAFPCTMVDRIVPHTTDEDIQTTRTAIAAEDLAPIITEPFSQWVIEKQFVTDIPNWQAAGVQLVDDVIPFEKIKLRMLNGSHSTLAYLGCLAGYETVADAMADPAYYSLLERLMCDEMQPTLEVPEGFDINAYREQLLERFANTAMRHMLRQIAMDGSQKLPQRLLPAIRERLTKGQDIQCLSLAVAAWIRYSRALDEQQQPFVLDDPLSEQLGAIHANAGTDVKNYLSAIIEQSGIFDQSLQKNELFIEQLRHWLTSLEQHGAKHTVATLISNG
jgi:fructuronate reductase